MKKPEFLNENTKMRIQKRFSSAIKSMLMLPRNNHEKIADKIGASHHFVLKLQQKNNTILAKRLEKCLNLSPATGIKDPLEFFTYLLGQSGSSKTSNGIKKWEDDLLTTFSNIDPVTNIIFNKMVTENILSSKSRLKKANEIIKLIVKIYSLSNYQRNKVSKSVTDLLNAN